MRAWVAVLLALPAVLAGCLGSSPAAEGDGEHHPDGATDHATERYVWTNASGKATATPATPFSQDFPFEVPKGAVEVQATVTWTPNPVSVVRLELVTPKGDSVGKGFPEKDGQRSLAFADAPPSGTWKLRVTTDRALDVAFQTSARVGLLVPQENTLKDTLTVVKRGFAEVNLIMEEGATFNYTWKVTDGATAFYFNIHSHENGETTVHEEGEYTAHQGSWTAPKRQIYSILWENRGLADLDMAYEVTGRFRVHSHSQ
ncbi:MAG TPA: hypothetical protein VM889_08165 [Candidatus Thermoplasmatota archaeon]|nr:hypothetical protein [Candidatus Thermoplasmatota archaeon]